MAKQRLPPIPNRAISNTLSVPIPSRPPDNAPPISTLADDFPKPFLRCANNANTAYRRLRILINTPNIERTRHDFHRLTIRPPQTRADLHPPSRTTLFCTRLAKRSTTDRQLVACYRALAEIDEPTSGRVSDAHVFCKTYERLATLQSCLITIEFCFNSLLRVIQLLPPRALEPGAFRPC